MQCFYPKCNHRDRGTAQVRTKSQLLPGSFFYTCQHNVPELSLISFIIIYFLTFWGASRRNAILVFYIMNKALTQ